MLNALQTSTEGEGGKQQKTNKNISITCLTGSSEKSTSKAQREGLILGRQDSSRTNFQNFVLYSTQRPCRGVAEGAEQVTYTIEKASSFEKQMRITANSDSNSLPCLQEEGFLNAITCKRFAFNAANRWSTKTT